MFNKEELSLIEQVFQNLQWKTGQSNLVKMSEDVIKKIHDILNPPKTKEVNGKDNNVKK